MPPPCVRRQKMDHGVEQTPWAIFPSVPGGAAKAAVLFSFKTEITNAREKLVAQRRRREGVYNRAAGASVTFFGGADARERTDGPRTGDRSIADFAAAKRYAGEFCFLCFITKEVPARHEGCKPAIPQKVYLPGCAGPSIFRAYLFSLSNANKPRPKKLAATRRCLKGAFISLSPDGGRTFLEQSPQGSITDFAAARERNGSKHE